MPDLDNEKQRAAAQAVSYVADGMRVGLGSGSTAAHAVRLLAQRIAREGLSIVGVPTSSATRDLALELGVPLADDLSGFQLDLTIDGADQATRSGDLIKGGGGAMLHERIVAAAAERFIVILDSTKLVDRLEGFPVPVEVVSLGWRNVEARLRSLGGNPQRRMEKGSPAQPFITDEGNFILDCPFPAEALADARGLSAALDALPGVVDHGLFIDMARLLIVARGDAIEEIVPGQEA